MKPDHYQVSVSRKVNDIEPITTRVSIGGDDEVGYYCVYRGTIKDARRVLAIVTEALKDHPEIDLE